MVAVINIPARTDRREHIEKQLASIGVTDYFFSPVFLPEKKHPKRRDYHIACCYSHLSALAKMIDAKEKHVWVVEDDADFNDFKLPHRLYLGNDLYYMGGVPVNGAFLQTHCYAVRTAFIPEFCELIKKEMETKYKIDMIFSAILPRINWHYHPLLPVLQADFGSDVSNI